MKWAIVFYAMISPIDGKDPIEHISWGLTFPHHEQCIMFYNQNKKDLVNGLTKYVEDTYSDPMHVTEIGCAHATANFDIAAEDRDPVMTLHMPLYYGGEPI